MIQFTNDEIVKQPITEDLLTNATPAQLTLLLFNGCCDFIKKGEDALSKKDYEQTNNWVQKAQSIISEFRCTLDPKYEIAKQLNPLYEYSYKRLMEGNMNSDITKIHEAGTIMNELKIAWKAAMDKMNTLNANSPEIVEAEKIAAS